MTASSRHRKLPKDVQLVAIDRQPPEVPRGYETIMLNLRVELILHHSLGMSNACTQLHHRREKIGERRAASSLIESNQVSTPKSVSFARPSPPESRPNGTSYSVITYGRIQASAPHAASSASKKPRRQDNPNARLLPPLPILVPILVPIIIIIVIVMRIHGEQSSEFERALAAGQVDWARAARA
jgi:hypothetical protein